MVCLLAAPWVQLSVSAGTGWPHNALRHHWLMPISCHFWYCKALLVTSLTHVSGAIASVQTFTFTFTPSFSLTWPNDPRVYGTLAYTRTTLWPTPKIQDGAKSYVTVIVRIVKSRRLLWILERFVNNKPIDCRQFKMNRFHLLTRYWNTSLIRF